jgi:hypothetical protein
VGTQRRCTSATDRLKESYDSVRKEDLCNILIEFGIPLKLARLIKMCIYETYSRIRVGKHLSDRFPIKNGLKQDAISPLLLNFPLKYAAYNNNIRTDIKSFKGMEHLKYLGTTLKNQKSVHEEIKSRMKSGNTYCHSVQNLLSSSLLPVM